MEDPCRPRPRCPEQRELLAHPRFPHDIAVWARLHQAARQQVLQLLDDAALSVQAAYLIVDVGAADTVGMLSAQHPRLDLARREHAVYDGWRPARVSLAAWDALAAALTLPDPYHGRRSALEQQIRTLGHRSERLGPDAPPTPRSEQHGGASTTHRQPSTTPPSRTEAASGRRALRLLRATTGARRQAAEEYETLVDAAARPLRQQLRQARHHLARLPPAPPRPPQLHAADRALAQLNEQARHRRSRSIELPGPSR